MKFRLPALAFASLATVGYYAHAEPPAGTKVGPRVTTKPLVDKPANGSVILKDRGKRIGIRYRL
ncbi:hypothetical protein EON80_10810, partial [bacterium]